MSSSRSRTILIFLMGMVGASGCSSKVVSSGRDEGQGGSTGTASTTPTASAGGEVGSGGGASTTSGEGTGGGSAPDGGTTAGASGGSGGDPQATFSGSGGGGASSSAGPATGGSGGSGSGGSGGGSPSGGSGGGSSSTASGGGAGDTMELTLVILDDTDDATWLDETDERLHVAENDMRIEVGADSDNGRAGLRFELPVPPGSTIQSATLHLRRDNGSADPTHTMLVQVFETSEMPPFDDTHEHPPGEHVEGGVWEMSVGDFSPGTTNSYVVSPDVSVLVQHVVDRDDWQSGGAIGFLLSPDDFVIPTMPMAWATFADSTLGVGAVLNVRFTSP